MFLYNSLTGTKEKFIPNEEKKVKLYTCGPTVYNYAHIGNLRSYIMEDILEKSLIYLGYDVKRAMNITDVGHLQGDSDIGEDKMLLSAEREKKTILEIAAFYTEAFEKDFEKLNLKWPEIVVPATSCIDTYIEIIEKLIKKGYAYFSNGNVYFDTSKLKKYNVFSNQNVNEMLIGARDDVTEDKNKRNSQDFVLWFTKSKFENQALKWNSPWGVGYPGWHIECSGISYKYLGEYLDIHCGGVDNKFPHHTNEIAQSESYLGHKWCNYWFHIEHLNLKNMKMSKSSGNFITLSKLEEMGYNPKIYKLFCLQSHYRNTLVFSEEAINSTKMAYEKLIKKISCLKEENNNIDNSKIKEHQDKFREYISNDLNTASAISLIYNVLKDNNINDDTKLYLINDFDKVLGLDLVANVKENNSKINEKLIKYIEAKIKERNKAKENKDYLLADSIREELLDQGVELIDSREGTIYKIKY